MAGGVKGAPSGGTRADGGGERERPVGHPFARGSRYRGGRGRGRRSPSPPLGQADRDCGKQGARPAKQGGRGRSRGQQDTEKPHHSRGLVIASDQSKKGDIPEQIVSKHKAPESVGEPNAKKKKKATLQCAICLEDHHTRTCALLLSPKPGAICCGLAGKGNGFF